MVYSQGEFVCTDCGMVQIELGRGIIEQNPYVFYECNQGMKKNSKAYQRLTHFKQRLSQLQDRDPRVPDNVIEEIEKAMQKDEIDERYAGKKVFSYYLHRLGYPRRLSSHYIQMRNVMGLVPVPECITMQQEERLHFRFQAINSSFNRLFRNRRKNIFNLNYILLQILLLENRELARNWAPFLPQLKSQHQPERNNQVWEVLMEHCSREFRTVEEEKTGSRYGFNWPYKPLSCKFINRYCNLIFSNKENSINLKQLKLKHETSTNF